MKNTDLNAAATTLAGSVAGSLAGIVGVNAAIAGVSAAAPFALVPYAAVQVGAGALGISSLLGGAAVTSSTVAAIGGPLVVVGAAVCLPAVIFGVASYGIYKIFK